jgi:hypothetical protein
VGGAGDLSEVASTVGCGSDPGQVLGSLVMSTIMTSGTKALDCADSRCGAWAFSRDYWVRLPTGYTNTKAYPLVFEGPGCGGHGNNLDNVPLFNASVIVVGLSPSVDAQAFHATNPGQGCFDTMEGDDSVDFVFYETLYDRLASTLCFDRNRVFAAGFDNGGWLANELGCKYAGDAARPIRGVMVDNGGLPTDQRFVPTCTTKPMTGFWSHDVSSPASPFTGDIVAINRALVVNGCTPTGVTYANAAFEPFPLSGAVVNSCKRFPGCPALFPVIVCPLLNNARSGHPDVAGPGWPTFLELFPTTP